MEENSVRLALLQRSGSPPILTTKRDGEPSLFLQCPGHLFRQKKAAKTGGERTNPARILARPSAEQPGQICREKCGRLKRRKRGSSDGNQRQQKVLDYIT